MIQKIRHKGLKKLYHTGGTGKVNPDHANKLRRILGVLDQASSPDKADLPGFRLQKLFGGWMRSRATVGGASYGIRAALSA